MMTAPASAIRDEVHALISAQIETFGKPAPLTSSQLCEVHEQTEKIRMLYEELDRMNARSIRNSS
jgi:hypothetical protein